MLGVGNILVEISSFFTGTIGGFWSLKVRFRRRTWPISAAPVMCDAAFGLYFALAFSVDSVWSAVLGWLIDHFGFSTALWTMVLSYLAPGALLLFIPEEKPPERA